MQNNKKKEKARLPAKYRKTFDVYLENVPIKTEEGITFLPQLKYSRLKMVPKTKIPLEKTTVKVPISDILLGYRKASYFLIYGLRNIDNEARVLHFSLKGITTIPSWKLTSRTGPNCFIHNSKNNMCFYVLLSNEKDQKLSKKVISSIRNIAQKEAEKFDPKNTNQNIRKIIDSNIGDDLKKGLVEQKIDPNIVKGVLVYQYLPKTLDLKTQAS